MDHRTTNILAGQQGMSLLLILIMVAVVGLSAAVAGSTWRTIMQRNREAELLFRGDQYRLAIKSYTKAKSQGAAGQFPTELENLLRDPRFPDAKRHIRKLFLDPMTGDEFEPIREGGGTIGRIKGVRSKSELEPFKKDNFPKEYDKFKGAGSYHAWEFVYEPPKPKKPPIQSGTPNQPGAPILPGASNQPGMPLPPAGSFTFPGSTLSHPPSNQGLRRPSQ